MSTAIDKALSMFKQSSPTASTEELLQAALDKIEIVEAKFRSGNKVDVERITIKRGEWFDV